MLCDNTNEDLIYKYILSLDEEQSFSEILKYSNYLSIKKIEQLRLNIPLKFDLFFRKTPFKVLFFNFLFSLENLDESALDYQIGVLKASIKQRVINNQPYDVDNLEALYYFFCILLSKQIEANKIKKIKYFDYLKLLVSKLNILKEYYKEYEDNKKDVTNKYKFTYEKEIEDFNKFFTIIFAIVNLDFNNYKEISQIALVLNTPNIDQKKQMIYCAKEDIKNQYNEKMADEFIEKVKNEDNYFSLKYSIIDDKIELLEESFLYDYIMENNIYKKYEKQILDLLNVIYKSDLIKHLFKAIYIKDDKTKNLLFFFDIEGSVECLWKNIILFIPLKIEKISGFSYKEFFKIFISVYKIKHFNTNLENEIFTLGAFVRTLIHETFGRFIIAYIFFMFYTNKEDFKKYDSPRMENQVKELNKECFIELIGKTLAEIYLKIFNDSKNKIVDTKLFSEYYEMLENKLSTEFEKILGNEYSKKLAKQLIEIEKNKNKKEKNEIYENQSKENEEKMEDNIISKKSKEIIEILFNYISEDFLHIINDMKKKHETYKVNDSGNFVEFLLFNDFTQDMTLKQCLFLLNEDNYKNTNLFKFRSEFKNLKFKENKEFLASIIIDKKIFANLISQYASLYESDGYIYNNFISLKNFRGNNGDSLNKRYESFQCFNIKTLDF